MRATISELRDDDRVGFEMPNDAMEWLTIKKVWRYDDGSITLEYKGRDPGMWRYEGEDLLQMVEVKRRVRVMTSTCEGCGRFFDLSNEVDAEALAYGHDCEAGGNGDE